MPRERKVYRFRLEPTKVQEADLVRFASARRWVFNWALQKRQTYYKTHKKTLPFAALDAELKALKKQPETAWLKEVDSQLLQQALRDLDTAFKSFFEKRARFPRFKSKKRDQARFRIPQRVVVVGNRLKVPKVGEIRLRLSQPVELPTKSATFKQDACGHWFVTLTAEFELPGVLPLLPPLEEVCGADAGLSSLLALSTGEKIPAPRFFRRGEKKLKREQRRLSRKQKGSRNYAKQKGKVAWAHRKVANQRKDFVHKTTTPLTKRERALSIEDLSVCGLARTKLAKSVLDAALGELRRQVEYKARWNLCHLAVVDRFFPSTKLCSACDYKNDALRLKDREWVCPGCGVRHDRDINAAINLAKEGYRILKERLKKPLLLSPPGRRDVKRLRSRRKTSHVEAADVEPRIPRV